MEASEPNPVQPPLPHLRLAPPEPAQCRPNSDRLEGTWSRVMGPDPGTSGGGRGAGLLPRTRFCSWEPPAGGGYCLRPGPACRAWAGQGGGVSAPPEAVQGAGPRSLGGRGAGAPAGETLRWERGRDLVVAPRTSAQDRCWRHGRRGGGVGVARAFRSTPLCRREAGSGGGSPARPPGPGGSLGLPFSPKTQRGFRLWGPAKEVLEGALREALSAAAVHVRGGVEDGPAHVPRRVESQRKTPAVCLPVQGLGEACGLPTLLPRGGGVR